MTQLPSARQTQLLLVRRCGAGDGGSKLAVASLLCACDGNEWLLLGWRRGARAAWPLLALPQASWAEACVQAPLGEKREGAAGWAEPEEGGGLGLCHSAEKNGPRDELGCPLAGPDWVCV